MKSLIVVVILLLTATIISGCKTMNGSRLLPSTEIESKGFSSYEQALNSFNMMLVEQTRESEMKSYGFDPAGSSNMKVLNYTDVVREFMSSPHLTKNDLPEGIRECLKAQGGCRVYEFHFEHIDEKRYGNFFADVFDFRKKTHTTGWRFTALIVIVDGTVAYSRHSGERNIDTKEINRNPLGPLQKTGEKALGLIGY